jgi:hypothetical protein
MLEIAGYLLEAEYRATILAACENARKFPKERGSRTLFLVLLGCNPEVGNPVDFVCRAIERCADLIARSGLKVFLVCENQHEFVGAIAALNGMMKNLKGKVIKTSVSRCKFDNNESERNAIHIFCVVFFVIILLIVVNREFVN